MNARLLALKAQAAALRSWADAIDQQVAEAETRAAEVEASAHTWLRATHIRAAKLPKAIRDRVAAGEYLECCSRCGCLRTSSPPWRFRDADELWSARKLPACSAH